MMHKKIINFSVVIMILLASSWAWSANIDNAPYASTVIKDGAFNINYVGHAGVIVQHIPHAASDDYLIIQETNPNIRLSGYVNFRTTIGVTLSVMRSFVRQNERCIRIMYLYIYIKKARTRLGTILMTYRTLIMCLLPSVATGS